MEQLGNLFVFLNDPAHRQYNRLLQTTSYHSMIRPWVEPVHRMKGLLYKIVETQGGQVIDELQVTYSNLQNALEHYNVDTIGDLANFCQFGGHNANAPPVAHHAVELIDHPYHRLFQNLQAAPRIGAKTAALFIKSIIDIHTWPETEDLRFIEGFELPQQGDRTYIPVDKIIWRVFHQHPNLLEQQIPRNPGGAFGPINTIIWGYHGGQHDLQNTAIRIWDDLWFWGKFSQNNVNGQMEFTPNFARFICDSAAPHHLWPEIEPLLQEFIALLQGLAPGEAP